MKLVNDNEKETQLKTVAHIPRTAFFIAMMIFHQLLVITCASNSLYFQYTYDCTHDYQFKQKNQYQYVYT